MASSLVISGLLKKRAELLGSIAEAEERLAARRESLRALDTSILLFDPDACLEVHPYRPRPNQAKGGSVSRLVLGFMRDAEGPVTLAEVTAHVMAHRRLDHGDKRLRTQQAKRIGELLRTYRRRGLLVAEGEIGKPLYWRIDR